MERVSTIYRLLNYFPLACLVSAVPSLLPPSQHCVKPNICHRDTNFPFPFLVFLFIGSLNLPSVQPRSYVTLIRAMCSREGTINEQTIILMPTFLSNVIGFVQHFQVPGGCIGFDPGKGCRSLTRKVKSAHSRHQIMYNHPDRAIPTSVLLKHLHLLSLF